MSHTEQESPCRVNREVERQDLEELNGRLQQYIMKQRAKDASREVWERDLKAVQTHAAEAIASNTKKYDEYLQQMRQQRDEHASAREELQVRVTRQESSIARLKEQIAQEKKFESDLSKRLTELTSKLDTATSANAKLADQLRQANHQLKTTEQAGRSAEEQLSEARSLSDQSAHEASTMRARCKSLTQDLAILVQSSAAEQQRLQDSINQLTKNSAEAEDIIRQDFASQLADIVEDYRKQCNDDKARITRELKNHYMPKLTEARNQIEALVKKESDLRERVIALQDESNTYKAQCERLSELKAVMEKRIDDLEVALDEERNVTHTDAIAAKDIEINKVRSDLQKLEQDFDDLMDVKIQLALTIEKYRDLLSQEEHRLGIETPGHKRKRARTVSVEPSVNLSLDEENECLTLTNTSSDVSVELDGWSLQNGSGQESFEFGEGVKISPNQSISVWFGERNNDTDDDDEEELVWEDIDPSTLSADRLLLLNVEGAIVDQIGLPAIDSTDKGGSNCAIM